MAITATHLVTESDTANSSTYTSTSISPSADTLVLIYIMCQRSGGAVQPNVSGCGITWELVIENPGSSRVAWLFRGVSSSPSSGSITFTNPSDTWTQGIWSISEFPGAEIGLNGADAFVQAEFFNQTGSSPSISLTNAPDPANASWVAGQSNDNDIGMTVSAGWDILGQDDENLPDSALITAFAEPAEQTITFGKTSTVLMSMTIAELAVAVGAGGTQTVVCDVLNTTSTVLTPTITGGTPPQNPVFKSLSFAQVDTNTAVVVDAPDGVVAGDLQFCIISLPSGDAPASTLDSAWTQILASNNPHVAGPMGENERVEVWYSSTDTGTVTFTKDTATHGFHVVRIAYSNSGGYNNPQAQWQNNTLNRDTTHTFPDQTTINSDAKILGILSSENANDTFTAPSGWTERYNDATSTFADSMRIAIADLDVPSPATISGEEYTSDVNAWSTTISLILAAVSDLAINLPILNTSSTLYSPTTLTEMVLPTLDTFSTVFDPDISTFNIVSLPVLNTIADVKQPHTVLNALLTTQVLNTVSVLFAPTAKTSIQVPVINVPANVLTPTVPLNTADTEAPLLTTESEILSPEITTFNTITCQVLEVPATVNSPGLKYRIETQTLVTTSTIFEPSLDYLINLPVINTVPTVHAPSIGDPPEIVEATGAIVKTHNPSPFATGI